VRRLAIVLAGFLAAVGLWPVLPAAQAAPGCGSADKPERGIPGEVPLADQRSGRADQGYNCGVSLVGYNSLGARGGNANMAWSQQCAYIAGDRGVAVVDVRDPTKPRLVRTLHGPGSNVSLETIAAVDAGGRHLLATGRYGIGGKGGEPGTAPVEFYDTTNCANPQRLSIFQFPANVHGLTFSPDGQRLFSTLPLQVADVRNPAKPVYLGNIEDDLEAAGVNHLQYAHEATLSPNGNRLYVGNQEGNEELLVIDIHNWPQRPATVLGRAPLPGHSIRLATINGKRYLLNSDESVVNFTAKGCLNPRMTPFAGAAQPYMTDISNEYKPHAVGQFHLPINDAQNCRHEVADYENASVHYQDVDDLEHTTFGLLSMWNAGMRIVDLRNPANPREVAYFNPGRFKFKNGIAGFRSTDGYGRLLRLQSWTNLDQAWAHIRYQPATGLIWLATQSGGFWVLELEPQVRAALGLPATHSYHPHGAVPRPDATNLQISASDAASPMYCTVGPVAAKLG
jgi:hypothetical protein